MWIHHTIHCNMCSCGKICQLQLLTTLCDPKYMGVQSSVNMFYVLCCSRNHDHPLRHSDQSCSCSSTPSWPFLPSSSSSFSHSGTTPHGQPMNTCPCPSGSKEETTSHDSNVKNVMRFNTSRNLITLVSCQLSRLRLLSQIQEIEKHREKNPLPCILPSQPNPRNNNYNIKNHFLTVR